MPTKETIRQAKYDEEHTRRIGLKLNTQTDADIIEQLEKQSSMQGYIRALIRADIAAGKGREEQ